MPSKIADAAGTKAPATPPLSEEEIIRRIQACQTYREWLEVTKLLPADDGGYDIVKALDENRHWSAERPLLPNEVGCHERNARNGP